MGTMRAMRATRAGGPEVLERCQTEVPSAGGDEVLIRVASAGVNFVDVVTTERPIFGCAKPPFIPGREVAGVEVATGAPVLALVAAGGYAEYVVARRGLVFDGSGLDLTLAGGSLLPLLTSYFILRRVVRLEPGEDVLVTAAGGGMGTNLIQVARQLGAGRIVAVASSPAKRALAGELGADECIAYEDDFSPVDIAIDGVGGKVFLQALRSVRQLGRMVALGEASGEAPPFPDYETLRRTNVGLFASSFRLFRDEFPMQTADMVRPALDMLRDGRVRSVVTAQVPLEAAADAWRDMLSRNLQGKVVLVP